MNPTPAFDHQEHLSQLDEADRFLRSHDQHALATAVAKARCIHIDMEGRIAQAQNAEKRLARVREQLRQIKDDMEKYVTKPDAPWLSPSEDLFPRGDNES